MPTQQQVQNRQEWTDGLRSGNYVQGFGVLATVNQDTLSPSEARDFSFCCLGVACELGGLTRRLSMGAAYYIFDERDDEPDDERADMPAEAWFSARFGVSNMATVVVMSYLAAKNDGSAAFYIGDRRVPNVGFPERASFTTIAKEAEWLFALADAGLLDNRSSY